MADSEPVSPQATDCVTQANVLVLGNGQAYSLAQSTLAMSQAQSVLFANMVSSQQQQTLANSAGVTKGVSKLYQGSGNNQCASDIASIKQSMETMTNALLKSLDTISEQINRF